MAHPRLTLASMDDAVASARRFQRFGSSQQPETRPMGSGVKLHSTCAPLSLILKDLGVDAAAAGCHRASAVVDRGWAGVMVLQARARRASMEQFSFACKFCSPPRAVDLEPELANPVLAALRPLARYAHGRWRQRIAAAPMSPIVQSDHSPLHPPPAPAHA